MRSAFFSLVLIVSLAANSLAFETDQYHLPPEPLVDIGDEVTVYVADGIQKAIAEVNAEIERHSSCLDGTASKETKCRSNKTATKKLAFARSDEGIADAVYKQLGEGSLFITVTGKWFKTHKFAAEPSSYKPSYGKSIFLLLPINYATISPTVKLYGAEFGTDKIEHFFQQGHKYYEIYNDEIAEGKLPEDAAKKAVKWGQKTERTYFGMLVSGVYSNGDLYANYAGMKFYEGLTKPLKIGDTTRPATALLKDGKWILNEETNLDRDLIRPFMTDHMNEALNPSGYSFILTPTVKRVVKSVCPDWQKAFPAMTHESAEKHTTELETWSGEDYGFTNKRHMFPIAKCFDERSLAE